MAASLGPLFRRFASRQTAVHAVVVLTLFLTAAPDLADGHILFAPNGPVEGEESAPGEDQTDDVLETARPARASAARGLMPAPQIRYTFLQPRSSPACSAPADPFGNEISFRLRC